MTDAHDLSAKTTLPVIVAPMFLVSTPELALAACAEGMVGSFPALNCWTSADFEKWLQRMNDGIVDLKAKQPDADIAPYAVNLIVNKTNPRLAADVDLCVKYKVPVIITSLGLSDDVIKKIHSYGGIVLHDVANVDHAKKAAAAGVDGLIAVSAGAGGHAGTANPMALIGEIRQFYDGFVALAGAVSRGQDILAAQAMGADFAYMGTRFIATAECAAAPEYKSMIVGAKSSDIIYTPAISGIPANFLKDSIEKAGFNLDDIKKQGMNATKMKSLTDEAKAWKNVWSAGQGAGTINDTPTVHDLALRLKAEYAAAAQRLNAKIKSPKPPAP